MLARIVSLLVPATLAVAAWSAVRALRLLSGLRGEAAQSLGPWREHLLTACAVGALACAFVLGVGLAQGPDHPTRSPRHLATLALVAVAWVALYQWLGQPYARPSAELSLGLAAGAYGLVVGLGALWPRRVPAVVPKAALAVAGTAIGFELALAAVASVHPMPILATGDQPALVRVASYRFAPGSDRFGMPCNSQGFYDQEFLPPSRRERPMVAMVGDSFTAGVVPHPYLFHTVAEEVLGDVDVYAFGVPAVGLPEYRAILKHDALPLRPDAVVLHVFAGNDLPDPAPAYEADARLRRLLDGERLLARVGPTRVARLRAQERLGALSPEVTGVGDGTLPMDHASLAERYPWVADHRLEKGSWGESHYMKIVLGRMQVVCLPHKPMLQELKREILAMRYLCGDVPFGVVLHPSEFQVETALWERGIDQLPNYRGGMVRDRLQRELAPWFAEVHVRYFDLLPVMLAQEPFEDGDRHLYLLRDTHYNPRGNRVAGEAIAGFTERLLDGVAGASLASDGGGSAPVGGSD